MNATGTLHVSCAAIALATGGYVIATVKGTTRHRWVGRAYAIAMLCLNGSALSIYHLTGHFGPFHYLPS